MRINVVLNRSAGSLLGKPVEERMEEIRAAFESAGHRVICVDAPGAEIRAALEKAKRSDADVLIVGGGDGTIATAVHVLSGSEKILGVLPLGTMNLLARDLDIPLDLSDAIAALAGGEVDSIDMAEVNGLPFLNNSVIGFYARMVQEREYQRGVHNLRKWPAMFIAALKTLIDHPRLEVTLDLEGGIRRVRTPVLAIANNAYDQGFGPILRRSDLSAGTLAVYVAKHRTRARLVRLALGFLTGLWLRDPELEVHLVRECIVHSGRSILRVANDGEVHRLATPLHYRIRPGALKVLRPARQERQNVVPVRPATQTAAG